MTIQANGPVPAGIADGPGKHLRLRPDSQNLQVLEESHSYPDVADASLITISELPGLTAEQFNTLEQRTTRELTISGVKLLWKETIPKLNALTLTRDVTKVTLIADEIEIHVPLRWKGAKVEVYARSLVFKDKGCIDTTPEAYSTQAFCEHRDGQGRPLSSATSGAVIQAKNGRVGENGGDITLSISTLNLSGTETERFICDGSPGEQGETGGLLPFEPRKGGPPNKDCKPIQMDEIIREMRDAGNSTKDINGVSYWRYPALKGRSTTKLTEELLGKELFAQNQVTDVRLRLIFLLAVARRLNTVYIPQKKVRGESIMTGFSNTKLQSKDTSDRWLPSNGENSYPSGMSGKGGDAGTVCVSRTLASVVAKDVVCRLKGGKTPRSLDVDGGPAGTPNPAYYFDLTAVQNSVFVGSLLSDIPCMGFYYSWTTQPGRGSAGSSGGDGDDGDVATTIIGQSGSEEEITSYGWLEPRLLRTVTSYAKTVLRQAGPDGRKVAFETIEPYWRELGKWEAELEKGGGLLPLDVQTCKHILDNLVDNLTRNLDIYGNPPGWVPRFSSDSYLQTYLADQKFSYQFCSVMSKALDLMEMAEHAYTLLSVAQDQNERSIAQTQKELLDGYKTFDHARDVFDEVSATLRGVEAELDAIKEKAQSQAELSIQEQAIVKGCFSIASSVLQAIPVYQPALSGVGNILDAVGTVVADQTVGEKPTLASDYVTALGDATKDFLEKNADTLKSKFDQNLKQRYAKSLDPDKTSLDETIAQLKSSIESAQTESDAAGAKAHDEAAKDAELADLLTKSTNIEVELKDAGDPDALRAQIMECDKLFLDLKDLPNDDRSLKGELAARKRQNLLAAKAKLNARLADAQIQLTKVKSAEAIKTADAQKTAARITDAEAKKEKLKNNRDKLDDLLPKQQKADAEERINSSNSKLSAALDGAKGLASGVAKLGATISTMMTPPEPDDPAVVKLRDRLLQGDLKIRYDSQMAEVERAKQKFNTALSDMQVSAQRVLTATSNLIEGLNASINIGTNRLATAIAIDPGVKTSFQAMQNQAAERMDYYLYLFRKAYMYEFCEASSDDVANINILVQRIDDWVRDTKKIGAGQVGENQAALMTAVAKLNDDDLASAGDKALQNTMGDLAKKILERRGRDEGVSLTPPIGVQLDKQRLEELSLQRWTTFDEVAALMPALYQPKVAHEPHTFWDNQQVKVADVAINEDSFIFEAAAKPSGSFRIIVTFGKEFVLRTLDKIGDQQYWCFRMVERERPITYGFVVSSFTETADGWTGKITPDHKDLMGSLFQTAMKKGIGEVPTYIEMAPSILTSMSIGLEEFVSSTSIKCITQLELELTLQLN